MIKKQRKKLGLRAKIKDYMDDVSIDVFGHEKKVTENISKYLSMLSKENMVSEAGSNIRLTHPNQQLEAYIYHFDRKIRSATLREIVDFFMGQGSGDVFDLEKKVHHNIMNYLTQYSNKINIPIPCLNIRISKPSETVMIVMYKHAELIESIPLKQLIKYFK